MTTDYTDDDVKKKTEEDKWIFKIHFNFKAQKTKAKKPLRATN